MRDTDKELVILEGEIQSPPFSAKGRAEVGFYLRKLQRSESLSMPISRPMPSIGQGCHELRIRDADHNWRIVYYVGTDNIAVLSIFAKKTEKTPDHVISQAKKHLADFRDREESE